MKHTSIAHRINGRPQGSTISISSDTYTGKDGINEKKAVNRTRRKVDPNCEICLKTRTMRLSCTDVFAVHCPAFCKFGPVRKVDRGLACATEVIYELLQRRGWENDMRYEFIYKLSADGYQLPAIKKVLDALWPEPDLSNG